MLPPTPVRERKFARWCFDLGGRLTRRWVQFTVAGIALAPKIRRREVICGADRAVWNRDSTGDFVHACIDHANAVPPLGNDIWLRSLALLGCRGPIGCGGDKGDKNGLWSTTHDASTPSASPRAKPIDAKHPVVRIDTNLGPITLKLDGVNAPGTVRNFLNYATEGFYDDTIVHFVDPGKMIVAGGYATDRRRNRPAPPSATKPTTASKTFAARSP